MDCAIKCVNSNHVSWLLFCCEKKITINYIKNEQVQKHKSAQLKEITIYNRSTAHSYAWTMNNQYLAINYYYCSHIKLWMVDLSVKSHTFIKNISDDELSDTITGIYWAEIENTNKNTNRNNKGNNNIQYLISGYSSGLLKIWEIDFTLINTFEVKTQCIIHKKCHDDNIVSCQWNIDKQCLATMSIDNTVKLWIFKKDQMICIKTFNGRWFDKSRYYIMTGYLEWFSEDYLGCQSSKDETLLVWKTFILFEKEIKSYINCIQNYHLFESQIHILINKFY